MSNYKPPHYPDASVYLVTAEAVMRFRQSLLEARMVRREDPWRAQDSYSLLMLS